MKFRNTKLSTRTLALLSITVLLLAGGTFTYTRAALTYFSNDYKGAFELNHLQVHLIENGVDVCHSNNDIYTVHRGDTNDGTEADQIADKNAKYKGNLVEYLGYTNDKPYSEAAAYTLGTPGTVEPGRTYREEIGAKNGNNVDEYVRLTVKKYWVKDGKKDTRLSPDLIKLTYTNGKSTGLENSKDSFNSGAWQINKSECTKESQTYYLTKVLPGKETSALLFDSLTIDGSVIDADHMTTSESKTETETQDGKKTVVTYTYEYDYDGYTFYIEADVQALQTHNVNDAIGSLWGVGNVTAKNGVVTVK